MQFSWQGISRTWYEFEVVRAQRLWEPKPGVYMFVKPGDYPTMEACGPVALYIQATDNFHEALSRNNSWGAAQSLGAQEVHLLEIADPAKRAAVEQDLIRSHTPILNPKQQRAPAANIGALQQRAQSGGLWRATNAA